MQQYPEQPQYPQQSAPAGYPQQPVQYALVKQKPGGLIALGVLLIIAGVFGFIGGLVGMAAGAAGSALHLSGGGTTTVLALISLVLGALDVAVGIGMLVAAPWAWTFGIITAVASLLLDIFFLVNGNILEVLSIALSVVVIWYLFTPPVQRVFGRAA